MHVMMTGDAVGGVWHYVVDLAKGLRARGVTVTIAILGPAPSSVQLESVDGLRHVTMDLPLDWTATSPAEVLDASASLTRFATSIEADLVHLHSPALAAAGGYPMPVVAVCHSCVATWWDACGSGTLPADLAWRRALAATGASRVDALMAPTAAFAEETARVYGLSDAPIVVHNGRFSRASSAMARPKAPLVFAAGRLWDRAKGMDTLDRVAAHGPLEIEAAGSTSGPNGEQVTFRNLKLLGQLDENAMDACLASRPVFVSLARYEPFGLAVLEAAQAGCSLVLADIASFRELWNGAALFVDPDDVSAVSRLIKSLRHDSRERERLGAQARSRSARYSLDAMSDRVLAVFRDLLAPARPAAHAVPLGGGVL